MRRILFTSLFILSSFSCKPVVEDYRLKHLITTDLSDKNIKNAQNSDFALQINLKTNRLTYFKKGKALEAWNIASADITGEYHKVDGENQKQFTPTGIFTAHDIEHCPSWIPRKPFNPETGKLVETEEERKAVFEKEKEIYGACGSQNPLGYYAFWFSGAYGVHGNSSSWILDLPVEDRRVSGGCIRNPNDKIKKVFDEVIAENLPEFKKKVNENLAKPMEERKTITATEINSKVDVKVIVGNWDKDPELYDPSKDPVEKVCVVKYTSPSGKLEIWKTQLLRGLIGHYNKNESVTILEEVGNVYRTDKGFVNKNYFGDCKEVRVSNSETEEKSDKEDSKDDSKDDSKVDVGASSEEASSEGTRTDSGTGAEDTSPDEKTESSVESTVETETEASENPGESSSEGTSDKSTFGTCKVAFGNSSGQLEIWKKHSPFRDLGGYVKIGDSVKIYEKVETIGAVYKTDGGYLNGHYVKECSGI